MIRGFESYEVAELAEPGSLTLKHRNFHKTFGVSIGTKDNSSLNGPHAAPFLSRLKARIFPWYTRKDQENLI